MDTSAACTRIGTQNCRDLLLAAEIELMTVMPMITSLLRNYKNPASGELFAASGEEGVYHAFAQGNLR